MQKAVVTCALTGVLTNPEKHPVPVTVSEMAQSAKDAFDAGASVMHVHFRRQEPGRGHLPTWDPDIAGAIIDAIRDACPGVIINMSTGVMGPDISGPVACLERIRLPSVGHVRSIFLRSPLWSMEDGEMVRELKGHDTFLTSVCATPDGKHVVTGSSMAAHMWPLLE